MEDDGGVVMRCLIPLTQEKRNENSIKRAKKLCDHIDLLYIVDKGIIDRMKKESSYILDSETLKILEGTLIQSQKKEAMAIFKEIGDKRIGMHFDIGDYADVVGRYALKLKPDLIMGDNLDRRMLSLKVPLWVERGREIKKVVFAVRTTVRLTSLKREIGIVKEISKALEVPFYIYTEIREESALHTLRSMGDLTESPEADLIVMQFFEKKLLRKGANILIMEGFK